MGRTVGITRDARGPRTHSSYRGDLQGLRGIAILVVVAFHVGLSGFSGGFIGVDVFFVISGFLITRILAGEVTKTGGVGLLNFWARRIRRLVPGLFVVVVATLVLGLFVYSPLHWNELAQQAGASALYVSNLLFARDATMYFATPIDASPYLHTWSLAVEEQFYLVWPFLFLGLALLLRRRPRWSGAVPTMLVVVSVLSFAFSYALTQRGTPWAFFSSPTRAWEFGIGGLTALAMQRFTLDRVIALGLGVAGLIALAYGVTQFDELTPYPGTAALIPVFAAAAILMSSTPDNLSLVGRGLDWGALRWIGTLSYSWYLWHWPLIVYATVKYPESGLNGRLVAAGISLLLAWGTTVWIENPVRFNARFTGSRVLTYAGGAALTLAAVAGAFAVAGWANHRLDDPYLTQLANARADRTELSNSACSPGAQGAKDYCVLGDPNGARTVMLLGDSHAAHWQPAIDALGQQQGIKVLVRTYGGCPAIDAPVVLQGTSKASTACPRFRARTAKLIADQKPDAVLVSSGDYTSRTLGHDGQLLSVAQQGPVWQDSLARFASNLRDMGIPLGVLLDVPGADGDPIECAAQHGSAEPCALTSGKILDFVDARHQVETDALSDAQWGQAFDPDPLFCDDRVCPIEADGVFRYLDGNHMTATFSRSLAPALQPFVLGLLQPQP